MSVMIEVEYRLPSDPARDRLISTTVAKHGGLLTDRDEPTAGALWPFVCLTFEFTEWSLARAAAIELWHAGERVDGPMEY